jgi:hypothetical protein
MSFSLNFMLPVLHSFYLYQRQSLEYEYKNHGICVCTIIHGPCLESMPTTNACKSFLAAGCPRWIGILYFDCLPLPKSTRKSTSGGRSDGKSGGRSGGRSDGRSDLIRVRIRIVRLIRV